MCLSRNHASVIQSFATSKTEEFRSFFLTRLDGIGTVVVELRGRGGVGCAALMDFRQALSRQLPACPCASLAMMTTAGKLA
jgi:hypothetical protein